ncbi:hypothetical protein [Chitinimonas sp.]|uniref:hypothetical protein n=1 Tax=Chitinimonas sp. TaxID=1934313 RepID=UPI0035AFAC96
MKGENAPGKTKADENGVISRNQEPPCFPAGTLVHTDKGLVPIQDIQVGDRVLSKCEFTGEQAYKRVFRTFLHMDKSIFAVWGSSYNKVLNLRDRGIFPIFTTGNHPFWVGRLKDGIKEFRRGKVNIGWRAAVELDIGDLVSTQNSDFFSVFGSVPLFKWGESGIAWGGMFLPTESGFLFDLRNNKIRYDLLGEDSDVKNEMIEFVSDLGVERDPYPTNEEAFCCTVYNLEVEDFHTYFVGEIGVWVHNKGGE